MSDDQFQQEVVQLLIAIRDEISGMAGDVATSFYSLESKLDGIERQLKGIKREVSS